MNYVYILREREHVNANESIYKIGKTAQKPLKRFNNYPKDSHLIMYKRVDDCSMVENKIKIVFKEKFVSRRDIGTEYFMGILEQMIEEFINITDDHEIDEEYKLHDILPNKSIDPEKKNDVDVLPHNLYERNKIVTNNTIYDKRDINHIEGETTEMSRSKNTSDMSNIFEMLPKIKTVKDLNNKEWFSASDITKILGYSRTKELMNNIGYNDTAKLSDLYKNGVPKQKNLKSSSLFLSECSLYRVIVNCRVENAVKYKEWIIRELLPMTRKTLHVTK